MRFKQYLAEVMDLDKSLKGISKPNKITWVFTVDDIKFRVFITDITISIDNKPYLSNEIMLQIWDSESNKWSSTYTKSRLNAGVIGGRVISILYDIIKTIKPRVFSLTSYNKNLTILYDLMFGRYFKQPPFNEYTPYFKINGAIKTYKFMNGPNQREDDYMMENFRL